MAKHTLKVLRCEHFGLFTTLCMKELRAKESFKTLKSAGNVTFDKCKCKLEVSPHQMIEILATSCIFFIVYNKILKVKEKQFLCFLPWHMTCSHIQHFLIPLINCPQGYVVKVLRTYIDHILTKHLMDFLTIVFANRKWIRNLILQKRHFPRKW